MLKTIYYAPLLFATHSVLQNTAPAECVEMTLNDTRNMPIYAHDISTDDCSLIYQTCDDTTNAYILIALSEVQSIKAQSGKVLYQKGQPCGKNLLNIQQQRGFRNWWSTLLFSILSFFLSVIIHSSILFP